MTRKLSEPKPQSEIISSFKTIAFEDYPWPQCIQDQLDKGSSQEDAEKICGSIKAENNSETATAKNRFAVTETVPPAKPAPTAETSDPDADVDTTISTLRTDLDAAIKAQAADPDATTDENDVKVTDVLGEIDKLLTTLEGDQKTDESEDSNPPPAKAPVPPTEVKAAKLALAPEAAETPDVNPVDEEGNVDPDAICASDGCGHLASVHNDTDTGENSGACTAPECECQEMTFGSNTTDGELAPVGDGGGPDNAGGDGVGDMSRGGRFADAVAPVESDDSATEGVTSDDELNVAPAVSGGINMGPAFKIPVAIIEGQPTGDGRDIALDALSWGPPPYALMGMATSTHDPMGFDPNDPAVLCGRIDSFERVAGEGDTQVIMGLGYFLANDDGMYFADLLEQMGRLPVSGDVTVDESEVIVGEVDEYGWPMDMSETLTKGTLAAVTILPFGPAFEGAYIILDDGSDHEPIPTTSDDVPAMPEALMASGQLVHWLAQSDCVPCDQGLEVLVASGGPLRPPKAWFDNPNFSIDDGRLMPFIAQGDKGMISGHACPPTVTDEGEVFGHLAPWGVCHVGQKGKCVTAPHSAVDYAHFKRGQHVITAEGDTIRVGVLTANTGHADLRASANESMSHYDNTAFQCADVVMFEDEFGIAYHGALRPDATEAQVRMLRASAFSGDWREIGGNLELVAALAVNQPGFPMAITAGGSVKSLVASGAWQMFVLGHRVESFSDEKLAELARGPMIRLVKKDANERLSRLRKDASKNARNRIKSLAGAK